MAFIPSNCRAHNNSLFLSRIMVHLWSNMCRVMLFLPNRPCQSFSPVEAGELVIPWLRSTYICTYSRFSHLMLVLNVHRISCYSTTLDRVSSNQSLPIMVSLFGLGFFVRHVTNEQGVPLYNVKVFAGPGHWSQPLTPRCLRDPNADPAYHELIYV